MRLPVSPVALSICTLFFAGGATTSPQIFHNFRSPSRIFEARSGPSAPQAAERGVSPGMVSPLQRGHEGKGKESNLRYLRGQYAILLRGYDAVDSPMVLAGSITADGHGSITAGEFDIDNGGGITPIPAQQTGTYTVDTSFHNAIRGQIDITSFTFPGTPSQPAFEFSLSDDGEKGTIIEFDTTGYRNAGTIERQRPSAFTGPSGPYAFDFDSDAPVGGRIVEAGQFTIAADGSVQSGVIDMSKAFDSAPIFQDAPITAGTATAPDSSGRGTLSLTVAGTTSTYAYYVVSRGKWILVQTDPGAAFGTAQSGTAFAQKPLDASSINMKSVIQMTGMDAVSGTDNLIPTCLIGVMTITNGGNMGLLFDFDTNDGGSVGIGELVNGTVTSFDPTTGRAVLSTPGAFDHGFVDNAVIYLYAPQQGFIIDLDPAVAGQFSNKAFSGTLTPQRLGPFHNRSVSGNLLVEAGGSSVPTIPNIEGVVHVVSETSTLKAVVDLSSEADQESFQKDITFSGTFMVTDPATGHGILPASGFGDIPPGSTGTSSFFLVGPDEFVLLGTQPNVSSGIWFFSSANAERCEGRSSENEDDECEDARFFMGQN